MTDPFAAAALKLVAGVGSDAGKRLFSVGARARERRALVRGELEADASVADAVARAATRLSRMHAEIPRVQQDALERFLASRDAAQLVRQLYIFRAAGTGPLSGELKRQFVESLAAWLGTRPQRLEPHAGYVFDAFSEATERALQIAAKHGDRGAESALYVRREAQLGKQLESIELNIRYLNGRDLDLAAIGEFEQRYRAQVLERESELRPPSFKEPGRYRLDELYVAPRLRRSDEPDGWLPYDEFARRAWKAVILGDPGGGKSSLAAKLCADTIQEAGPFQHANFPRTPVLIRLRDYLGEKSGKHGGSILDYARRTASSRHQLSDVPRGAFEYLLRNGRAFFVFDELDEVLNRTARQEVVGDIESVIGLFPQAPAFVLSRRNGYGEAPLRGELFTTYVLGGFGDAEVGEYARRWFARRPDAADPGAHERRRDAFLAETASLPDLRTNPLMLGLLANMSQGRGWIPENRPMVLEECATMLYDAWDRRRAIFAERSFRPDGRKRDAPPGYHFQLDLKRLLESLADWIFNEPRLQEGVTEDQLVEHTADFLHERVYAERDEGREAAKELIGFCSGRAWVFSPVGPPGDRDRRFQFTHTTFLEFFAASYVASRHASTTDLFSALWPRIANGEADQMVQIAMHIQHKRVEQGSNQLIDKLLDNAPVHEPQATAVLALTARSLAFLEPDVATTREAVRHVMIHAAGLLRDHDASAQQLLVPLAHPGARIARHVASECTALSTEGLAGIKPAAPRRHDLKPAVSLRADERAALEPYVKDGAERVLALTSSPPAE